MSGAETLPPWVLGALLVALAPFAAIVLSSYVKFAVVLSVLRSAIGGDGIPPRSVGAAVALLLSVFVMAPVGERMWNAARPEIGRGDAPSIMKGLAAARGPLREFLERHTPALVFPPKACRSRRTSASRWWSKT